MTSSESSSFQPTPGTSAEATAGGGGAVLRVTDLSVTLENQAVLERVSFTVKRGEILTILGPNGAGKTVLLRALLGVLPHAGSIEWEAGLRVGYVPQRLPYIRDIPLRVVDFFALKQNASVRVGEMLRAVGLDEGTANHRMGDLSSGQFQRILIAWALSGDPRVLLFDEPTTGVDIRGEETVYGLLTRLNRERNMTMLIVTHDLSLVYQLSSTVLCLNREVLCHGSPITVLTPESLRQIYGTEVKYYQHQHERPPHG